MAIHFPDVPATFRNIPRTGTTSFKFWVRANIQHKEIIYDPEQPDMLDHQSLSEIQKRWPYYGTTFAFVRNPYDRLVSIFHFVGQQAKKRMMQRANKVESDILQHIPVEVDLKILFQYKRGFNTWIKTKTKYDVEFAALHLFCNRDYETQLYYLDHVVPDIVVKLENIDTEFIHVQNLLQCYKAPLHVNSSVHGDYRQYYDSESKAIATKWMEEDLETFKYLF